MSSLSTLRKVAVSLAIFAVVTVASATWARADTVTLNLNTGSTLPNQNYGTVTLTLVGNAIQVDISLLPPRKRDYSKSKSESKTDPATKPPESPAAKAERKV